MRGALVLLLVAALSGCTQDPAPVATLEASAPPLIVVQLLDDEMRPIAGGDVRINRTSLWNITDELGLANLPHPGLEQATLLVWAPGYYRDSRDVALSPERMEPIRFELKRRPGDVIIQEFDDSEAVCELAYRTTVGLYDRECAPLPTGGGSPDAFFGIVRKDVETGLKTFHNLTVTATWASPLLAGPVAVEASIPGGTIGSNNTRYHRGAPPLVIQLDLEDVAPGLRDGKHALRLRIRAEGDGDMANLWLGQKVLYDVVYRSRISAPDNPSWDPTS